MGRRAILAVAFSALLFPATSGAAAAPPQRIASLNLTADELLVEMLPPGRLVAVTRWADDPEMSNVAGRVPDSAERMPRTDLERLIALRPDLVVVSEYTDADFLHLLTRSGLRSHRLVGLSSLSGIRAAILDLGRAVGTEAEARKLVARMDRVLGDLQRRLEGAKRPRVLYWADPYTAGAGTSFGTLIEAAGGENLARSLGLRGVIPISGEQAFTADPDVWLVTRGSGAKRALLRHPLLAATRAARTGRIIEMPNRLLVTLSDHAADACWWLAARLHPRAGARDLSGARGPMSGRPRAGLAFGVLALALPVSLLAALSVGSVIIPPWDVIGSACAHLGVPGAPHLDEASELILWSVRLPRVLIAALVGGGLAVVGASLQALFRNPLADAGLLGVGPGAAVGAVLAVQLGWAHERFMALPLSACVGAALALLATYALAHVGGRPTLSGLLLTGLAVSAVATAGTSILLVAIEEFRVRTVLFWLAGGLEGRGFEHAILASAFVLPGAVGLFLLSRTLDVLSLGEEEAAALSLPVHTTRLILFGLCALIAGPVTAVAGSVPFVGLVAPHALRTVVGPLGRRLVPASFLAGAVLVVIADLAARTLGRNMELPLGAVTAIVGAPYFLLALRGQEGRG